MVETSLEWQEYFFQFQDTTDPCHIHLSVCLWIMDPHSRAPKKNTCHGNEVLLQDTTHFIMSCCWRRLSCLSYLDYLHTNELWPRFRSAYRARHSTETAVLRVLNNFLTASDDGQVPLLNLLDLSAAFDILTMTSSSIGSKMFSAYRILLFLSSDPILLRQSKWYPLLATAQTLLLSFMAYHRAQFLVPIRFFSTHNHSHRLFPQWICRW